jgi:hypothetical protein
MDSEALPAPPASVNFSEVSCTLNSFSGPLPPTS